jgi:uracil-DNA glycosylase
VPAGGETGSAAPYVPKRPTLPRLREAAAGCRGCHLWERATQTVFGEGAARATVMLVGEQPGDQEDLAGRPFVGPAGRLLDEALEEAGIDRRAAYVTNVVKHFKWEPRGKRRIHAKLAAVSPQVLVCLGATAAQALIDRQFRVTRQRGQPIESPLAPCVLATVHPSSILRQRDEASRHAEMAAFVEDLKVAAAALDGSA